MTREKRGLRFLGELFADLTDTASPDDFDRLQRVTKDLVEVTNDEEIQIKYLKTKLEKTTNALTNYIQETNELNLNLSKILQNQILINKNSTELGTHLDILHTQAMTIISHANNEVEQKMMI